MLVLSMSFHRSELLVVRLLGPLQVTVAGEPRAVPGGKQQLLLSLLALADDQPVLIDTLIAGLWGSAPPRSATRALQVHVSRLRTVLQCPIENINNVAYRLPGAAHVSDVREFLTLSERGRAEATAGELLAAAATFETALRLWRGSALGGLAECYAGRAEARRLEEARNQTRSEWVEAGIETDQAEGVIGALRSSLEHDPLQEHRWRQLVLALHRTGRHGEALNAYRQARQVFIEELGIEPGRVLRDVHAELQRAALQGTTAAAAPLVAGTAPGPAPLIGRDAELDLLLAAWRRSRSGLQLVCLTGETGVGKSRLADELAARAAAAGTRVLTSRADPQVTRPFHHFTELLRAAAPEWLTVGTRSSVGARLRDHLPSLERIALEIAQLSPERREHPQAPVKHGTDFRLGDAVAAWLEALSQDLPLLLIFDDMHWADAGTVQLLRHVLSSPREIKVLIVVAMRQHHAAVNSERGELDRTMVTALLRQSEETVHVPLRRLTRAQPAELLEAEY